MSTFSIPQSAPSMIWKADSLLAAIPLSLPMLALRFGLAVPFFTSGLTKWDGWFNLSLGARYLFEEEFKLHIFGAEYPYPAPIPMAYAAGICEILLPVLLVLGLGTRFAALGLLGMTAVIQLTVPDGWANFHLPWAAMALTLVVMGGGRISLDGLFVRLDHPPIRLKQSDRKAAAQAIEPGAISYRPDDSIGSESARGGKQN